MVKKNTTTSASQVQKEAKLNIKGNKKIKTVLIVDDETDIQKSITNILKDLNYSVLNCLNPIEVDNFIVENKVDVVLLDIWMADKDGLQILRELKKSQPHLPIIVMSGHANITSMMQITKLGADAFLEKPFSREELLLKISTMLFAPSKRTNTQKNFIQNKWHLQKTGIKQKTLSNNIVVKGKGLHSGANIGIILTPLKENSGIVFEDIASGTTFLASHEYVNSYHYATKLQYEEFSIGCVEHLLSALHIYGITNVCIKVSQEVPILDGSSIQWCEAIENAGVVEQNLNAHLANITEKYEYIDAKNKDRKITIEPYEGLYIDYTLELPAPISTASSSVSTSQRYTIDLTNDAIAQYKKNIAPARTFGFTEEIKQLQAMGLAQGAHLSNGLLIHKNEVFNQKLRFEDEFARHKILDIIGDLFLIGGAVRGKIIATQTGHHHNIELIKKITSS